MSDLLRQPEEQTADEEPEGKISEAEEIFDHWRRRSGFVLAPVAFCAMLWFTRSAHLSLEGRRLSAVLAAVAVLWITESLPLPVTALLGACLCVLLKVAEVKTALASFADPIVFLFIGSFILARAMMLHGLDRRLALAFLSLRWVGGRPGRVLASLGLATAVISMWVSNTATAAMMLPIAMGMLQALHTARSGDSVVLSARTWPFATGMMLMVAYAASIGGIGTPVGSPPNLIARGYIHELAGRDIDFFTWMALCVPLLAVMGIVLFGALYLLHRPGTAMRRLSGDLGEYLRRQRQLLGPWTPGQINTLIAFLIAVFLWVLPGVLSISPRTQPAAKFLEVHMPESIVALLAAALLFVLPVKLSRGQFTLTWTDAAKIDWGTILLFGGGLSLGTLMFKTGVANALGESAARLTGVGSLWALTALSIALGILLSEMTSNTAAATMIIPIVIAMAQKAGVNPLPPALGACLGASYGFMLPVSTPPNAIVYGSGLVPITKMIRAGVIFDVLGFVIILVGLRILCPLLGLA